MRRTTAFYFVACAVAALVPFVSAQHQTASGTATSVIFPGWPTTFAGKTLTPLPLNEMETSFASDFPGHIARFTDGERELIIRWVTEPTRKLHPSSDCFQGLGYPVTPLAAHRDERGTLWSRFTATKGTERLIVLEQIHADSGQTWTDVSAWYWSALQHDHGSWWAITVAEKAP
ncbi:MAG TPA: hypothetical protein VFI24_09395 [Pyrinomonadaceae bacterium]|nr:hypothetical protein [Pyrinomonadaceae bacterium]